LQKTLVNWKRPAKIGRKIAGEKKNHMRLNNKLKYW